MSIPAYKDTSLDTIDAAYNRLSSTFAAHTTIPLAYRLYNLKQLAYMIKDNEDLIFQAMKIDLDRDGFEVQLSELWMLQGEIDLAVKRLPQWSQDESKFTDTLLAYKPMLPRVRKQPKGIALIISTWNYPWQLSLAPLIGAIAAGCPVILKPSEHSPTCSALLADLIPKYLDPEAYAVVLGGPEHSTKLLEKPWGHVVFTGSGNVGKIVAGAAAKTLTPTTLELGGKSPVVISSCANLAIAARRMLSIKKLGLGQMCVAPDYVLCESDKAEAFFAECTKALQEFEPPSPHPLSILHTPMASAFRSSRDYERINQALSEVEQKGYKVYRGEKDAERKKMGMNIVLMPEGASQKDGLFMNEEIFGPVIPIIPIKSVDAAIKYINDRPHPLALYVCSGKRAIFNKVLEETTSGSITWNDFGFATISRTIPFGGVGESGWGAYHGVYGYETFTHRKAVLEVSNLLEPVQRLRYPPNLNAFARRLFRTILTPGISFSRPVSVEREAAIIRRSKTFDSLVNVLRVLIMVCGVTYLAVTMSKPSWLGIKY